MPYVAFICRVVLGVVFGWAALSKLRSRREFSRFVRTVPLLAPVPDRWAGRVGALVVIAESIVAVSMLDSSTATLGCYPAAALSFAFVAVAVRGLQRSRTTTCRCFGTESRLGRHHVVRNGGLALLAVTGAVTPGAAVHPAGAAIAGAGSLLLGLLFVRLDDLVALFSSDGDGASEVHLEGVR
jgi:hypothetical protein